MVPKSSLDSTLKRNGPSLYQGATLQSPFSDTWSPQKLSLNHATSLNRMILCSNLKNRICKIVTKSQVVTKVNVTKSRLHCTSFDHPCYILPTLVTDSIDKRRGQGVFTAIFLLLFLAIFSIIKLATLQVFRCVNR